MKITLEPIPSIMTMRSIYTLLCTLLFYHLMFASQAFANDRCCAHCGCHERVSKICRLVREDKKITATCWGVEEEAFCVNGPSCEGCKHCETICRKEGSDKADAKVCSKSKALTWTNWIPQSNATVLTKKKLMKKTVTKSVPSFRWVVEDLCDQCRVEAKSKSEKAEPKSEKAEPRS